MCTTNCILFLMHGCANSCNKPPQPYSWTIGSIWSAIANAIPTLCISFLAPWYAFPSMISLHSSQITFSGASTSAPFCKRTSTISLQPFRADTNKGVAPSWGMQHDQQMQRNKSGLSENNCWTRSFSCPSVPLSTKNTNTYLTASKYKISTCFCSKRHAPCIGKTHWPPDVSKHANHMSSLAKAMFWTNSSGFEWIQMSSIFKFSNKAWY